MAVLPAHFGSDLNTWPNNFQQAFKMNNDIEKDFQFLYKLTFEITWRNILLIKYRNCDRWSKSSMFSSFLVSLHIEQL